jgi:hypothetical protein
MLLAKPEEQYMKKHASIAGPHFRLLIRNRNIAPRLARPGMLATSGKERISASIAESQDGRITPTGTDSVPENVRTRQSIWKH